MAFFSQRKGLKPIKSLIQKESMDNELRNSLWNVLHLFLFERAARQTVAFINRQIWMHYYKGQIDSLEARRYIYEESTFKEWFEAASWNEVYDLLEAVILYLGNNQLVDSLVPVVNNVLERELSAYRMVEGKIVEITSEEELSAIDSAIKTSSDAVQAHLQQAIVLWFDREKPDYRNSIKESILAVEALCKQITKNPKATLGDALKEIEKSNIVELHTALKDSFLKLYGYTNDAHGIRHAMNTATNLSSEDARYMIVSCSTFINYLIEKAQKAGINLQ